MQKRLKRNREDGWQGKYTELSGRTYLHLEMMNFQKLLSHAPTVYRDNLWFTNQPTNQATKLLKWNLSAVHNLSTKFCRLGILL